MTDVNIYPHLRTSGGEVCDIVCDGQFVGTMSLVYREGERLAGTVQFDSERTSEYEEETLIEAVNDYVEMIIEAVGTHQCEVMVGFSPFEYVIATEQNVGTVERMADEFTDEFDADDRFRHTGKDTTDYELVIIGEVDHDQVEYHVYDGPRTWVAEAFIRFTDGDAIGEIIWRSHKPDPQEVREVVEMLISDFDEDEIDFVLLDIQYGDERLETIELLQHEAFAAFRGQIDTNADGDYSVRLVRDDKGVLTFEIDHILAHGHPVAQATIDTTGQEVSGFIDLFEEHAEEEYEEMASLLLQEIDKERDYSTIHLTILFDNEPIDELTFASTASND